MKKIYIILVYLFLIISTANAQFVGYYNLHDGGVDMPNSSLFVLSDNSYFMFYYAGYKAGKWEVIDKNNIRLIEKKTNTNAIVVCGKSIKNQKEVIIDVYAMAKSHSLISFSTDTISKNEFQPIFNESANCLDGNYKIKKKSGQFNWVTIAHASNPDFGRYKTKYPYKSNAFRFPLNKKYNNFVIFENQDAMQENMNFVLSKNDQNYAIDSGKNLEREDLTAETLKKIQNSKIQIDKEMSFAKFGTNIPSYSIEKIVTYKSTQKPIFIAKCDDTKPEVEKPENNFSYLPTVDRSNGFYSVDNFEEVEYDPAKYNLSKKPFIDMKEIESINKIISDNGGYEIELIFTEKGKLQLTDFSQKNIRKPMAIVVNKTIVSAPIISSSITEGKARINGNYSDLEINFLIEKIKE